MMMTSQNIEQYERELCDLLAQIRASLADYEKVMGECAARFRHEATEAHTKHDTALRAFEFIKERSVASFKMNAELIQQLSAEWPRVVDKGAREAAGEKAKEYVNAHMSEVQTRLSAAAKSVETLAAKVGWQSALTGAIVASALTMIFLKIV
jgi:ElaB/YqjD/DUF883 family membrane-anchored ribosome-binding protein